MPRKQPTAPKATVRLRGATDQRMATIVQYDKKFPDRKHFWKGRELEGTNRVIKSGVAKVVKTDEGEEVTNGISVLCSTDLDLYKARSKETADYSYEAMKEIRGNFSEMRVPLRKFANHKTPSQKE